METKNKVIEELMTFTLDKNKQDVIMKKDNHYCLNYNGKQYVFTLFSDYPLQECDKKYLLSEERYKVANNRSLKLACSMDLVNPKIIIGTSSLGEKHILISFIEQGIEKVISYDCNLVINKQDYYYLFNYQELNCVDKYELYSIYEFIKKDSNFHSLYECLLFTKQYLALYRKQENFSYLNQKYDRSGLNFRNYTLLADNLFFTDDDIFKQKYINIMHELNDFTENPQFYSPHIQKKGNNTFTYTSELGNFEFRLLSKALVDTKAKKILESKDRYFECHENSVYMALTFGTLFPESTYLIAGKYKSNEIDYYYHSWVSIKELGVVINFNSNVIMKEEDFLKFFEAEVISETSYQDLCNIITTLEKDWNFIILSFFINYFGKEIIGDLERNKDILKK